MKELCGALFAMGDELNEKQPSLFGQLSGSYFWTVFGDMSGSGFQGIVKIFLKSYFLGGVSVLPT